MCVFRFQIINNNSDSLISAWPPPYGPCPLSISLFLLCSAHLSPTPSTSTPLWAITSFQNQLAPDPLLGCVVSVVPSPSIFILSILGRSPLAGRLPPVVLPLTVSLDESSRYCCLFLINTASTRRAVRFSHPADQYYEADFASG